MTKSATVHIVDDDECIVKPIVKVVESIGLKAKTYPSAKDFLDQCKPDGPACLVLDVWMPDMSGVALLSRMAEAEITLPVIVISAHADVRLAVEVMRNGAMNFLEKPFRMHELSESIQEAIRIDRDNWRRRAELENARNRFHQLSQVERQVLDLLAEGKTNKMIATKLGISVRTVENRRARIMKKLDVGSRTELLELARSDNISSTL
ncbi:MAG: response regulator transcription factor [Pirellulaceae bacterium]